MDLMVFENEGMKVNTVLDDGEIWFLAKDVCDILELQNVAMSLERLDEDEKIMQKVNVSGKNRDTWFINESGLYSLIMTSNKPEAKKFKKWVTGEVLPSIRKTGSYTVPQVKEQNYPMELAAVKAQAIELYKKLSQILDIGERSEEYREEVRVDLNKMVEDVKKRFNNLELNFSERINAICEEKFNEWQRQDTVCENSMKAQEFEIKMGRNNKSLEEMTEKMDTKFKEMNDKLDAMERCVTRLENRGKKAGIKPTKEGE